MSRPITIFKYVKQATVSTKEGGGFYNKTEDCKGVFHQFGSDYEEFESGAGNYSTAIVELPNGEVRNVPVELIRFDDKEQA